MAVTPIETGALLNSKKKTKKNPKSNKIVVIGVK